MTKEEALENLIDAVREWRSHRIFIADECKEDEYALGHAFDQYEEVQRDGR